MVGFVVIDTFPYFKLDSCKWPLLVAVDVFHLVFFHEELLWGGLLLIDQQFLAGTLITMEALHSPFAPREWPKHSSETRARPCLHKMTLLLISKKLFEVSLCPRFP